MHFAIEFNCLSYTEFTGLKDTMAFETLPSPPSEWSFGETIYAGNTSDNQMCFLFEYHNEQKPIISFIILSEGKSVFYQYDATVSPQTVQSLIRGNITKFCLQAQGHYCLHASAICIEDKVVLFSGRKGAGKSTMAAYFHKMGHQVWCDDYAMMQHKGNAFFVSQGDTSLKINPDTATALRIPSTQLQPVFELPPDWKKSAESDFMTQKFYFNQKITGAETTPRQVAALFFMNTRIAEPEKLIAPSHISTAFSILMDEILLPGLNSRQYLATYFQSSMNLLETVPTYNIYAPDNIGRIHEVYESLLATISKS